MRTNYADPNRGVPRGSGRASKHQHAPHRLTGLLAVARSLTDTNGHLAAAGYLDTLIHLLVHLYHTALSRSSTAMTSRDGRGGGEG
jgi:hypothetical protein